MSVKSKLARQAVKTTAKHTARGAASKAVRKPFRSITLLAIGGAIGAIVGWRLGRAGGAEATVQPPAPTSVVTNTNNTPEHASETGAVS